MSLRACWLLWPWLSACSVASVDVSQSPIAQNVCNDDGDCGGGICRDNRCYGRSGQLSTFLFEVTPASGPKPVAGVQLKPVTSPSDAQPLRLDPLVQVKGSITAGRIGCTPTFLEGPMAPDNSVPAQLTLKPSQQVLGLYSPPIVVQTTPGVSGYVFEASVAPGDYDIYVEPHAQQAGDSCVLPPQLVRQVTVTSSLTIDAPPLSTFQLDVSWPPQTGTLSRLEKWYADILDPVSGRVISNRVELVNMPTPGDPTAHYIANLVYAPIATDASGATGQELIRLQFRPTNDCQPADAPMAGTCADVSTPTLFMARKALSVFTPASGTLTQFTHLPTPVHVEGQVTRLGLAAYAEARVTLVAKQLADIDPGLFAAYSRTVKTASDGSFSTDLLPGTYAAYAVPTADFGLSANCGSSDATRCLAQTSQSWDVAALPTTQGGRLIELSSAIPVTGAVADFVGHPMVGAQVQAVASPAPLSNDVLVQALGSTDSLFIPRASSDLVAETGSFKIWSDPGTFDLSVRPDAGTGFAWLVRPSVSVAGTDYVSGLPLGVMQMPLPISYAGTVEVPDSTGAGALIRAYVYMQSTPGQAGYTASYTNDPSTAQAVLQVAETRADSRGHFELLIPAKLNLAGP